jgi:hypothetical protein
VVVRDDAGLACFVHFVAPLKLRLISR